MKVITLTIDKDTTLTYLCWGAGLIEKDGKTYFTESCDETLHDYGDFDAPCIEVSLEDLETIKWEMWADREDDTPLIHKYRQQLRPVENDL